MVNQCPSVDEVNAYDGHPELTKLEADVLWEYAKLAKNVKSLLLRTRELSEAPDQALLGRLRVLERKLGFVLTLFKASVWAAINDRRLQENESYDSDYNSTQHADLEHTITRQAKS